MCVCLCALKLEVHQKCSRKCGMACLPVQFFFLVSFFPLVCECRGGPGHMVRCGRQSVPAAPQKQQKANRSIFGEGAREHSHRASLGTLAARRRRCEEEATKAGGNGGGRGQDV